jgi:hypothetical protein
MVAVLVMLVVIAQSPPRARDPKNHIVTSLPSTLYFQLSKVPVLQHNIVQVIEGYVLVLLKYQTASGRLVDLIVDKEPLQRVIEFFDRSPDKPDLFFCWERG